MKLSKTYKNKLIIATNILWLMIVLVLVVFYIKKPNNYKESIKSLTSQRDSLKVVVIYREYILDSLKSEIDKQKVELFRVDFQKEILEKKLKKYEQTYTRINDMSIDGNIELLTKYLSEKDCYRK
jgi:hypothetical protein